MSKPVVKITVETFEDGKEYPCATRDLDHNDGLHREWLQKHIYWAMRNGRDVVLSPIQSSEA